MTCPEIQFDASDNIKLVFLKEPHINSDEIKTKFIDELNELGFEVIKEI